MRERRLSRLGGVEVVDPAAAVAKLVVFDADNVARALARVVGMGPNADAVAAEVVADEEPGGWRKRTQGR